MQKPNLPYLKIVLALTFCLLLFAVDVLHNFEVKEDAEENIQEKNTFSSYPKDIVYVPIDCVIDSKHFNETCYAEVRNG